MPCLSRDGGEKSLHERLSETWLGVGARPRAAPPEPPALVCSGRVTRCPQKSHSTRALAFSSGACVHRHRIGRVPRRTLSSTGSLRGFSSLGSPSTVPFIFGSLLHDLFADVALNLVVTGASARLRGQIWSPPGQKQQHKGCYVLWDPCRLRWAVPTRLSQSTCILKFAKPQATGNA